jgi:alpha-L-rhamnosidase
MASPRRLVVPLLVVVAVSMPAAWCDAVVFAPTRLRVDYLSAPITIDTNTPKFSWALDHPTRGESQTAYQITVSPASSSSAPLWDSGKVLSNRTLNILYAGPPLASDSEYDWTVTSFDSTSAPSAPASSTFSTALINPPADFAGAEWLTTSAVTPEDGGLNTYRSAPIHIDGPVVRARLYVAGMGYAKTWINGRLTDDHELGSFTTFEKRVLYGVVDVSSGFLAQGCNTLGIMLGHGWFAQPTINSGPRQVLALLSVTTEDGTTTYYPTSVNGTVARGATTPPRAAGAAVISPLTFQATAGPVTADDIYIGESYDARVAAALDGWSTCAYAPPSGAVVNWSAPVLSHKSPLAFGSRLSAHRVPIRTDLDYAVVPGGPSSPAPGVFVYDFAQNMAGQATLTVNDCPAGTVILLRHAEILFPNGSVHNHYLPEAPMLGTYTCSGATSVETYRYLFTYMGFRYIQLEGYPGTPSETTVRAHFIHSDLPQTGEFLSSSATLNAIQHATRYASWSNLMDVPTDCPQRERRGWLGDASISFDSVIHNVEGAAFYAKWLADFVDSQEYNNVTMGTKGALPDCVPYYSHGHTESDPGWGIAAWAIAETYANMYDDAAFEAAYYPSLRWYMEHWIDLVAANNGTFPVAWFGDWMEIWPGPWNSRTVDYPNYFFLQALAKSLGFATRLGIEADVERYTGLLAAAQTAYLAAYYNASTGCFLDCNYVSHIFGLALGVLPQGSPEEAAAWDIASQWFTANGTHAQHPGVDSFGGGMFALDLVYPLLDRLGKPGLGLRWQLQPTMPSFAHWIGWGATTLVEAWDLTPEGGTNSYNHAMFGVSGDWYYSTLAGLGRAPGSRSWSSLVIAPPTPASEVLANLSWASASIDTPMGLASSAWSATMGGSSGMCGSVGEGASLTLRCDGGLFTGVVFASYGSPAGDCDTGFSTGACNINTSASVVAAACVGQANCTVPASSVVFGGDPCVGTPKTLAVEMRGTCQQSTPAYSLQATIPVNAVASVAVPSVEAAGLARITEGTATVWEQGAFVPGTAGITGAVAGPGGDTVVFSVGSGTYSFAVYV